MRTLGGAADPTKKRLTVTMTGPIAFASVVTFIERQQQDEAWSYALLYDFGDIAPDVTDANVHLIAAHVGDLDTRRARGPSPSSLRTRNLSR